MSGGSHETTPAQPERDEERALRDAVAALNDLVLFGNLDQGQVRELIGEVAALNRRLSSDSSGRVVSEEEPRSEPWGEYRRRSPFAGTANPRSPGLRMRIDPDTEAPTAHGTVTVGAAFAGPPGFVHGGIVAGLLDEAIGWLASATVPDAAVVTGKLSVRFPSPTPVNTPLELQVVVTRHSSYSLHVHAEVTALGQRTASGEALMVVRR